MTDGLIQECEQALRQKGLLGLLCALNAKTPYRFTGIYRFEGEWVKSVWLYDRTDPTVLTGSDVLWDASYCRLAATDGERCEIRDSLNDARLITHAAREVVQCYVAVVLHFGDRTPVGTLCHYDVKPRSTPADAFEGLRAVRPLVEDALRSQLACSA